MQNLDGVRLASSPVNEQICVAHADGSVGCTNDYREPVKSQLGIAGARELSVAMGDGSTLRADGTIQRWQGPEDRCTPSTEPLQLPSPATQLKCTGDLGCAVTADGRLFCFDGGGSPNCQTAQAVAGIDDALEVAITMEQLCVLHRGGTVSCAPLDATSSQIGNFDPPLLSGAIQLQSSRIATCALEQSGQLKCWGLSECGSLGIAENCGFTLVSAPLTVQSSIETRRFGMSDGLTCSEDASGDVWRWGFSGWNGQAEGNPTARRIAF